MTQKITSKLTSTNQIPAGHKLILKYSQYKITNLDIGAGKYDAYHDVLKKLNIINSNYDPFNRSALENDNALKNTYDTITVHNVLNVIMEKDIRLSIIKLCYSHLQGNTAFFTVYEGDRLGIGKKTSKGWQENRKTKTYLKEIDSVFDSVERIGKLILARKK